jgi:hypothetical protein
MEEAIEAAMALGPTSRALQDQGTETRAAVATSIRRALQPYQRGNQVPLAGAMWLVTANNAQAWRRSVAGRWPDGHESPALRAFTTGSCTYF